MFTETFYVVWALVPLTLLAFTIWATVKKYFGGQGREDAFDYLKQTFFCSIIFALSVYIDAYFLKDFVNSFFITEFDPNLFRWLLFFALLFLAAKLSGFRKPKKSKAEENLPGSSYSAHVD